MDREMMELMVDDFLIDQSNAESDNPLVLDGAPYLDEDTGEWTQNAHDAGHHYTLTADPDGNIRVVP